MPSRPSWNVEPFSGHISQWAEIFKGFVLVFSEPGTGPWSQEVLMSVYWMHCRYYDQKSEGQINEVITMTLK